MSKFLLKREETNPFAFMRRITSRLCCPLFFGAGA